MHVTVQLVVRQQSTARSSQLAYTYCACNVHCRPTQALLLLCEDGSHSVFAESNNSLLLAANLAACCDQVAVCSNVRTFANFTEAGAPTHQPRVFLLRFHISYATSEPASQWCDRIGRARTNGIGHCPQHTCMHVGSMRKG